MSWVQYLTIRSGRALEEKHANQLDQKIWSTTRTCKIAWCSAVFDPFDKYHDTQIDEDKRQKYDLRDELKEDIYHAAKENVIQQSKNKTEEHLQDTNDNSELHLH